MKEILLNNSMIAVVDDSDYEIINKHKWSLRKDMNTFYAYRNEYLLGKVKSIQMHRQIMFATDPKQYIDHIDGDGLNNQKNNLRVATHGQNRANSVKRQKASSPYKGVSWRKKDMVWQCHIRKDRKQIYLGCFKSEIEAAIAYNTAAVKLHGEFANINIV